MDKKSKPHRQKVPTAEELADATPRATSFDTEEGRAAQGMRPDIGDGRSDPEKQRDEEAKRAPESRE